MRVCERELLTCLEKLENLVVSEGGGILWWNSGQKAAFVSCLFESTGWPEKSKPLPNDQKIVLNRINACE